MVARKIIRRSGKIRAAAERISDACAAKIVFGWRRGGGMVEEVETIYYILTVRSLFYGRIIHRAEP